MNLKNHIIFNIICVFFIKNINIIYISNIEWHLFFFSSIISCVLPDIDSSNSFIGKKIFFSKYISKIGHRKITHSLIFIFCLYKLIKLLFKKNLFFQSIINGLIIGYINHILADSTTTNGVYILWPIKYKFKIKYSNLIILILIICVFFKLKNLL